MKRVFWVFLLAMGGCSTAIPLVQRWPAPPCDVTDPAPLDTLKAGATLTDLMQALNANYGRYHVEASKIRAWNRWYGEQQAASAKQ
jgi:hypothetical protein